MKIPETSNPFKVIVNGVEKNYEAGATVSDDASVKEIIDNADTFPPEALPVETPFPIPEQSGGTNVVANPTLAGTEDSLTGIQIGDTKYAVGGSGGGMLILHQNGTQLDKTWKEITDAGFAALNLEEGGVVEVYSLVTYGEYSGAYFVTFTDGSATPTYVSTSQTGYPELPS